MRLALALLLTTTLHAQWDLQTSHTTASLRGIHALGNGVAWASGTDGTVLRTTDDGLSWQRCPTPPAAEHLDFRGIQAFDATTAIVMSSGKGDLSRLYKTTDGCQTWKLVFTNPDKDGFWDAISMSAPPEDALGKALDYSHAWGYLLGDPVDGVFALFSTTSGGDQWSRIVASKRDPTGGGCRVDAFVPKHNEAVFAASNESLISLNGSDLVFVTGGDVSRIGYTDIFSLDGALCHQSTHLKDLPMAHGNTSSGAFAMAAYPRYPTRSNVPDKVMIVGGDYQKPEANGQSAYLPGHSDCCFSLVPQQVVKPQTPPHGYRSAVAYSPDHKAWITVGPNGTDLSTDDGRHWRALKPGPTEPPDADRNWNALSLPFVVGPQGRIGRLRPDALPAPAK